MFSVAPYYERAGVQLYNADALAHLHEFRPSYFVLTITDPPYNTGQVFAGELDRLDEVEYRQWSRDWLCEVMCFSRAAVFTPGLDNLSMWYSFGPPAGVFPLLRPPSIAWEPIIVIGDVANTEWFRRVAVCLFNDEENQAAWHPCPKPESFYFEMYRRFGQPGDTIFEPFAGSGTALRVALKLGLSCVAFEDKEAYCERIALDLESIEAGVCIE